MVHTPSVPNKKKRNATGYDGFKRITGTKMHIVVEQNGLYISIVIDHSNQRDSTRFINVMRTISDFLNCNYTKQIVSIYADEEYDLKSVRGYLKSKNIADCIHAEILKQKTIIQIMV